MSLRNLLTKDSQGWLNIQHPLCIKPGPDKDLLHALNQLTKFIDDKEGERDRLRERQIRQTDDFS